MNRGNKLGLISTAVVAGVVGILIGMAAHPSPPSQPAMEQARTEPRIETPAEPKTWQKVAELKGTNTKRGEVFHLSGAQARLSYATDGDEYSFVTVYVVEEGESLNEIGGIAEVSAGEGSGDTRLVNPSGNYYLDVSGYGSWTVTVEELR